MGKMIDVDVVVHPVDVLGDRGDGLLEADLPGRGLARARQRRQGNDHATGRRGAKSASRRSGAAGSSGSLPRLLPCMPLRAAPACSPGKAPAAPCTSYLTNAPSSRAASALSTVPARLRRRRAASRTSGRFARNCQLRHQTTQWPNPTQGRAAAYPRAKLRPRTARNARCAGRDRASPGPISAGFIGEIKEARYRAGAAWSRSGVCRRVRSLGMALLQNARRSLPDQQPCCTLQPR